MNSILEDTKLLILKVTNHCNFNCLYCYEKDKNTKHIDFSNIKKLTHKIIADKKDNTNSKINILYHGGEPLALGHARLMKFLDYMSKNLEKNNIDHVFSMQTNLSLLDNRYAEIIKKYDIRLGVSFDGVDGANLSRSKELDTEFYRRKFKLLSDKKIHFSVLLVCNKNNLHKINKARSFFRDLGIKKYKINHVEDVNGCGLALGGAEFFEEVLKASIDDYIRTGHCQEDNLKRMIKKFVFAKLYEAKRFSSGCDAPFCGAGRTFLGLDVYGNFLLCGRFNKDTPYGKIGSLFQKDFLGISQIKRYADTSYEKNKALYSKKCDFCPASVICEFGCMAFSLMVDKKIQIREDVVCAMYKRLNNYMELKKEELSKTLFKGYKEKNAIPFFLIRKKKDQFANEIFSKYKFLFTKDKKFLKIIPGQGKAEKFTKN